MGSVATLLQTWASDGGPRYELYGKNPGLVHRWLNDGQLRFSEKSEILHGVWQPIFPSSGKVSLPDDFLQFKGDTILWDSTTYLPKVDYEVASIADLSSVECYSIHNGYMYVFAPTAGTPSIPYIRKPDDLLFANIASDDLELPTEFQDRLILYLDAQMARRGNDPSWLALLDRFDGEAFQAGIKHRSRQSSVSFMRGGML